MVRRYDKYDKYEGYDASGGSRAFALENPDWGTVGTESTGKTIPPVA